MSAQALFLGMMAKARNEAKKSNPFHNPGAARDAWYLGWRVGKIFTSMSPLPEPTLREFEAWIHEHLGSNP